MQIQRGIRTGERRRTRDRGIPDEGPFDHAARS